MVRDGMVRGGGVNLLLNAGLAPIDSRWPVDLTHFGDIALRPYQWDVLARVALAMQAGYRRVLVVMPTGAGKTVLAKAMMRSVAAQSRRGQFIVHRKELLKQTSGAIDVAHGFISAGLPMSFEAPITLAGIQTLATRLARMLPPDLVIADEAHHSTSVSWSNVFNHYRGSHIVGLTATPQRLDGRGLGEHFDIIIEGPSVADLIGDGWLSPFDYYAPHVPNTEGLRTLAGDFERAGASALVDRPAIIGSVVEHYLEHARGKQGITFASSIEHSRHLVAAFVEAGVRARHVDGQMSDKERAWIDEAYRAGEYEILSNVELFGEGYDVPGIEYVGLARLTKSLALHRQQCGRALRVLPGKERAIICDHAGNALRGLGLPDADVEWTLEAKARGVGASRVNDDATSIRQCGKCFLVSPSTVRVCPRCATEFPVLTRAVQERAGRLSKVERAEIMARAREKRVAEERACRDYADFYQLGLKRGYPRPVEWAQIKAKLKSGRFDGTRRR